MYHEHSQNGKSGNIFCCGLLEIKCKTKQKYYTMETALKCKRKMEERWKIYFLNTQIHDRSQGTPIKSERVKLEIVLECMCKVCAIFKQRNAIYFAF